MMFLNRNSKRGASRLKNRRGGAILELAIALPLLIVICIGVMDFGRVYFTSVAVSNAARAGAEWGITYPQSTPFQTANQISFAQLDGAEAGGITVTASTECKCGATTVTCNSTTDCGGGFGAPAIWITATASKSVAMLISYPGIPSTVPITRTAIFRAQ